MRPSLLLLLALCILVGCVSTREHYGPAGFASFDQARPYVQEYQYFALKLSPEEWREFYARFPDYWKDMQTGKALGSSIEQHPAYTAYAFRWTTLRKADAWPPEVRRRLNEKVLAPGDDIFRITYALGPPARIVWNNRAEILVYSSNQALILSLGTYKTSASCAGCSERYDFQTKLGMPDEDVQAALLHE